MAEAADQAQHEFWRPPAQGAASIVAPVTASASDRSSTCRCGTEYLVSSLYCHACGARRSGPQASRTLEIPGLSELKPLAERLGLTIPAVVAFLAGIVCVAGALLVGIVFTARTALDWQAIQMWRIEWLLAAIAAFVGGCLLKK
jgi:hypothetical protein